MNYCFWLLGFALIFVTACEPFFKSSHLAQDKFIQAYFNHRATAKENYLDPYRQIERGGDNLEAIIIQEIESAKFTIDLAVQELNLPAIAQALVDSHRSGIEVRVIVDNNYSRPLSSLKPKEIKRLKSLERLKYQEFFALADRDGNGKLTNQEIAQGDALLMLQRAGVPLLDDTADGSRGSGLMHHKFMVVDDKVVITGSANFTLSGLLGDFHNLDTRGNVNHLLRIERPEVAQVFLTEFNYMWGDGVKGRKDSKFGLAKSWRSPIKLSWDNTQMTIQFAPTSPSKSWSLSSNGLIGKTIADADHSLELALFVFSDRAIANILQEKQQQGIEVKGIFDSGFAFRDYSGVWDLLGIEHRDRCFELTDSFTTKTSEQNIGVANLASGDKLHHKFALIDDDTVISGSQNWSLAGNHTNDEVIMVIENITLAQHFNQEFQRLASSAVWGLSTKIQAKLQRQRCQ